jgi:hypothetical protein
MSHQDPKQEVINQITRLLLPRTNKIPAGNVDEETPHKTLRFLKERTLPGRSVFITVFEDERQQQLHVTCYVEQDTHGNWHFRGAAGDGIMGGSPGPVVEQAWANLGGGGMPDHFYAGGFVANHERNIVRVRLVCKNGTILEDLVENDMVLFLTDQHVDLPIVAELYDQMNNLIYSHKVLS